MSFDREFTLRRVPRTADQTHEFVASQGWICSACRHQHAGEVLAFICIGCPCERRNPTIAEFDRMRVVDFEVGLDEQVRQDAPRERPH